MAIAAAEVGIALLLPMASLDEGGVLGAALNAMILSAIVGPLIFWRVRKAVLSPQDHVVLSAPGSQSRSIATAMMVLVLGMAAAGLAAHGAAREVHREGQAQLDRLTDRPTGEAQRRANQVRYGTRGPSEDARDATDGEDSAGEEFSHSQRILVSGREWTVPNITSPEFYATIDPTTPSLIALAGVLLSLLAAGFTFAVLTSRARAMTLALDITSDLSEAKLAAEEAVREMAAFRATIDQHSLISVTDGRGRIIDVNSQFCEVSGFEPSELLGQDHRVLGSGEHTAEFWKRIWAALSAGDAWRGEICNRAKNGSLYWIDSVLAPSLNAEGKVEGFVSISHDVTARKAAETGMIEVSERLGLATQAAGVGIWEYDLKSSILVWDDQMFQLYGARREDFGGAYDAWVAGVHPGDQARCNDEVQAAIRGDREFDTEFRVILPSGTVRHIKASGLVQRDEGGHPYRMIGTNWDITDQRNAATDLQAATHLLEEAQSVAKMGNWFVDLITDAVTWSKQLYSLVGRSEAEGPPGRKELLLGFLPDSADALHTAMASANRRGEPFSLVLQTSHLMNGVEHLRVEGRARRDENGIVVALFGTTMDVTEEVQAAERLRKARSDAEVASRSKSAFLANMSHEIRTPLTAILGFADLLRDEESADLPPRRRIQAVETIHSAGTHLLTVINDILDLSKIEADRMTIETIDTSLVALLCEVEDLMRPRATGKGITLETAFTTPVPDRILSDPTRLRQIIMNLVGNAIKFTEAGSVKMLVRVAAREDRQDLVLEIIDTGTGMTEEQSGRLFEAFGQANEAVTRKYGGTGLGLTICRRLAGLMGGGVRLVSTDPGRGSTFEVEVPLELSPGAVMVSRPDSFKDRILQGAKSTQMVRLEGRILLAEDGLDNQRLISLYLRKAGANVELADNGKIALEQLREAAAKGAPFDLLLTDMQMPEMDGYALAKTLRDEGSTLPIIALTANVMAEDRTRCLAAGCDDYATKPIHRDQLLTTCAEWLGKVSGSASAA